MRIQHNIAALNSYRQLTGNNSALSKNLEKLSSGYRINRAGDDAAGLAISEKMRAQIKGLEVAQKNANDGISLVQTAEGALTEVHSMLNRMVELATQSANGTYDNETSRANLQKEIKSLLDEVDRISESTNFNSINLLDGSIGDAKGVEFGTAAVVDGTAIGAAATIGKTEVGELQAGKEAVAAESYFYMPEKVLVSADTSGAGAAGTTVLSFQVNDGAGGDTTVTLTLTGTKTAAGDPEEVKMEDIAKFLNDGTALPTGGPTATVAFTGGAIDDATKLKNAYSFKFENNKLVITAKNEGSKYGIKAGVTVSGTGGAAGDGAEDIAEMTKVLHEDYASATGTAPTGFKDPIDLGAETKESIKGADAVDGKYKVASTVATLTDGTGGKPKLHGSALEINGKTYIMKDSAQDLDPSIDTSKVTVVEYNAANATDYTKNDNASVALAQAVNKAETDIQAKVEADGKITFSETEAYGNKVYAGNAESIDFASIIKPSSMKIGGSGANKEITITDELTDGMQVTVNGKTYEFVKDGAEATKGKIAIAFKEGDAAANAQALFDAIQANDATTAATATITGAKINLGSETVATDANSKGLTLQVGDTADNFQKVNVVVKSTSAASLGIDGIDISTQDGASAAIDKIKAAINQVSSTRGDLGATQNRLEHTINNLGVTTENLTAAESRIRDTDMAEEMMNYTKNNILVQAAQAMLAQANTVPQGVLQLLQ